MKKKNWKSMFRYIIQIIFFVFISYIAIKHLVIGGGPARSATVHAYCPFGAIESLYSNVVHGTFVWKITFSSYILLFAVIVIGIIFGKGFCGWICPFGSLQEWIRMLGAKLTKRKKSLLPAAVDEKMRYLKYGVVLLILIPTYITGRMVFENYDPFVAFFHFGKNITRHLMPGYIILGVVIVFSLFIGRFWCRYFCPLGAVLGLINKISLFKIKRDSGTCTDCGLCDRKCPVDIPLANRDKIKSAECIACLESEQACPEKGALLAYSGGLKFNVFSYGILLLVSMFLFIGVAKVTSNWETTVIKDTRYPRGEGRRVGKKEVTPLREAVESDVSEFQEKEKVHEEEIKGKGGFLREGVRLRGSMTLKEAAELAELDYAAFCNRLKIPASTPSSLRLKDIMIKYDLEMDEITALLRGEELVEGAHYEGEVKGEGAIFREGVRLRGSMTLKEVAELAGLDYPEFCRILKIPTSTASSLQLKDIMTKYNLEMGQITDMLRGKGAEIEAEPQTEEYRPSERPQRGYGKGRAVLKDGTALRGSMTLREIAEHMGVTHKQLCAKLQIPASTSAELSLKDIMIKYNYRMREIRDMLEE